MCVTFAVTQFSKDRNINSKQKAVKYLMFTRCIFQTYSLPLPSLEISLNFSSFSFNPLSLPLLPPFLFSPFCTSLLCILSLPLPTFLVHSSHVEAFSNSFDIINQIHKQSCRLMNSCRLKLFISKINNIIFKSPTYLIHRICVSHFPLGMIISHTHKVGIKLRNFRSKILFHFLYTTLFLSLSASIFWNLLVSHILFNTKVRQSTFLKSRIELGHKFMMRKYVSGKSL